MDNKIQPPYNKNIESSIGKAIKFWRKIEGFDQKKLSDLLGTSRAYVAKLETGHMGVSISRIGEMAVILGVSPYTIMRGIPNDEELDVLRDLYADRYLEITKSELEVLFCQRFQSGSVTHEYYEHILCIERGSSYRCSTIDGFFSWANKDGKVFRIKEI